MEADYAMTQQAMQEHDRHRGDENLYVMFYKGHVEDREASLKEGRPIFKDSEFIKIIVPGDKNNIIDRTVREEDKRRFPKQYQAFRNNEEEYISGTPLENWQYLSSAQVAELKYFGVRTVEQLANVNDSTGQNFSGFNKLKKKAAEYIEASASDAPLVQLQAELEERDQKIEEQERTIQDLIARIEALEEK